MKKDKILIVMLSLLLYGNAKASFFDLTASLYGNANGSVAGLVVSSIDEVKVALAILYVGTAGLIAGAVHNTYQIHTKKKSYDKTLLEMKYQLLLEIKKLMNEEKQNYKGKNEKK